MPAAEIFQLQCNSVSGERLRRARERAGLTRHQLAARAAVHPMALKRWEVGSYTLAPDIRARLAATLNVPEDALLWPRTRDGRPILIDPSLNRPAAPGALSAQVA